MSEAGRMGLAAAVLLTVGAALALFLGGVAPHSVLVALAAASAWVALGVGRGGGVRGWRVGVWSGSLASVALFVAYAMVASAADAAGYLYAGLFALTLFTTGTLARPSVQRSFGLEVPPAANVEGPELPDA